MWKSWQGNSCENFSFLAEDSIVILELFYVNHVTESYLLYRQI